jgi:hypothetical protein
MLKLIALTTLVLVAGAPVARADSGEGNQSIARGQAIVECNDRANVQELKGQERKDFVDWCVSREEAAAGDNLRPDRYSECYARMTDPKLTDVDRGQYLRNCAGNTAYHMHRS